MHSIKYVARFYVWFVCCVFALLSLSTLAADAAPSTGSPAAAAPLSPLLMSLIPLLVPVVIAVAKFFLPNIPKVWLPIIAPLLGAAVAYVTSLSFDSTTLLGAVLGSAGVGLREIGDQLKKLSETQ